MSCRKRIALGTCVLVIGIGATIAGPLAHGNFLLNALGTMIWIAAAWAWAEILFEMPIRIKNRKP